MREVLQLISAHYPEIAKYLSKAGNDVKFVLFSTKLSNKRFWDFFCANTGSASDQLSFPLDSWTKCPTNPLVSAVHKVQIPLIQRGISTELLCFLQQLTKRIQINWLGNTFKPVTQSTVKIIGVLSL